MKDSSELAPIESPAELIAYLESGCKSRDEWRIGTEHEKFGFRHDDLMPPPYDGESGIGAVLAGLADLGWDPVDENGKTIALYKDGCSVTLEPGGQLELSGAPLRTLHETCCEVDSHLREVQQVCEPLGVGFLGMGFHPLARRDQISFMPKKRYQIMSQYMPKKGTMGLDMMLRTCTIQVNLDFSSERDMIEKFRIGLALQPLATALFANSPFTEGRPNGWLSYRSHAWTQTDPDRVGMLPFVFDESMGFERWVDYLLDVPMYFVRRKGQYIDASGKSFRDFMAGKLDLLPGELPNLEDFKDHMTTVFPEVRLKTFLEMRGADGGPWRRICALPAFWVGLLYDADAQQAALDLVKDWTVEDQQLLRNAVPKQALRATIGGRTLQEIGKDVLAIAHQGLANRARLNDVGDNETGFLTELHAIVDSGQTPAERKLDCFANRWKGDMRQLFAECAF